MSSWDDSDDELHWAWIVVFGVVGVVGLAVFSFSPGMNSSGSEPSPFVVIVECSLVMGVLLAWALYKWLNHETVKGSEPAFESPPDVDALREYPERLEQYEGLIESIGIIRTPHAIGGEGGGGAKSSYESFAIDINGETPLVFG